MSAFGKKGGAGGMRPGAKPAFGVARPMKDGSGKSEEAKGGKQFPPLPGGAAGGSAEPAKSAAPKPSASNSSASAMDRLTERMNATNTAETEAGGFEASVHKIKEQVLPRLLERVDPEAAATLTKEELSEEFRPIIMEVLAELKVTLPCVRDHALMK